MPRSCRITETAPAIAKEAKASNTRTIRIFVTDMSTYSSSWIVRHSTSVPFNIPGATSVQIKFQKDEPHWKNEMDSSSDKWCERDLNLRNEQSV